MIDPLVFSFVWQEGITLNDVIYHGEKPGKEIIDEIEGYSLSKQFVRKPLNQYTGYGEMSNDLVSFSAPIEKKDLEIYYPVYRIIDVINFDIKHPVCGVVTKASDWDRWIDQTNPPELSCEDERYKPDTAHGYLPVIWVKDKSSMPYKGSFLGGEKHLAQTVLSANFGYAFDKTTKGEFPSGEIIEAECVTSDIFQFFVEIEAVHDWDEWEVIEEASIEKEGLKIRKCKGCDKQEEEVISKPASHSITFDLDGHEGSLSINYPKGETIVLPKPQ